MARNLGRKRGRPKGGWQPGAGDFRHTKARYGMQHPAPHLLKGREPHTPFVGRKEPKEFSHKRLGVFSAMLGKAEAIRLLSKYSEKYFEENVGMFETSAIRKKFGQRTSEALLKYMRSWEIMKLVEKFGDPEEFIYQFKRLMRDSKGHMGDVKRTLEYIASIQPKKKVRVSDIAGWG